MGRRGEPGDPLTEREKDCVALLAEGLSDHAIALRLHMSSDTAKDHLAHARNKIVPYPTGRVDLANAWRKMQGGDESEQLAEIIAHFQKDGPASFYQWMDSRGYGRVVATLHHQTEEVQK